jgi:RNA polymerase sigma-70 factor (family 1)
MSRIYKNKPDAELVALLQEGDKDVFAEIYERYWLLLFRHALRMTRDQEIAEDIVQDVFTLLLSKGQELTFNHTLASFLYSATRFRVLDKKGRMKTEESYIAGALKLADQGELTTERQVLAKELAIRIEAELEQLPEKMREVFVLSRVYEYSYKEISQKLNITDNTVKKQISNALKLLRTKLHYILWFFP